MICRKREEQGQQLGGELAVSESCRLEQRERRSERQQSAQVR